MPRKTQRERAAELGTSVSELQRAKADGVEIWRDEEIKPWLANKRPRSKVAGKPLDIPGNTDAPEQSLEDLEAAARRATDYTEIKIIKEQIGALQIAQKVRKESGELVSLKQIDERDTRIAAAVKGSLLKLSNDAPPMLEGLPAAKIQKRLKELTMGILDQLANDQSEFWKQ